MAALESCIKGGAEKGTSGKTAPVVGCVCVGVCVGVHVDH